jgi:hypothetical protein
LLRLSVRNGVMFYPWEGQFIQASVLDNGMVTGTLPGVQLSGNQDGPIIRGDVTDGRCGIHFTVKRIGG